MRRRIVTAFTVALAIAGPGVVAAQGPRVDLVAGTAQFTDGLVADTEWHVNAKSGPMGENPQGHFFVRLESAILLNLDFRGRVTCLNVTGNVAVIGGEITASRTPDAVVGQGILIEVTDNGEGNDDPPDTFNGAFTLIPPQICPPAPLFPGAPATQGNFVVHDAF